MRSRTASLGMSVTQRVRAPNTEVLLRTPRVFVCRDERHHIRRADTERNSPLQGVTIIAFRAGAPRSRGGTLRAAPSRPALLRRAGQRDPPEPRRVAVLGSDVGRGDSGREQHRCRTHHRNDQGPKRSHDLSQACLTHDETDPSRRRARCCHPVSADHHRALRPCVPHRATAGVPHRPLVVQDGPCAPWRRRTQRRHAPTGRAIAGLVRGLPVLQHRRCAWNPGQGSPSGSA
jgi:hypothetical protein